MHLSTYKLLLTICLNLVSNVSRIILVASLTKNFSTLLTFSLTFPWYDEVIASMDILFVGWMRMQSGEVSSLAGKLIYDGRLCGTVEATPWFSFLCHFPDSITFTSGKFILYLQYQSLQYLMWTRLQSRWNLIDPFTFGN